MPVLTVLALVGCSGQEHEIERADPEPASEGRLAEWEMALAEESRGRHMHALADPPGDAKSQQRLGVMYYTGEGLDPDYAAALEWFRRSADQGHDVGQLFVGVMYLDGHGVGHSNVQAHMWFNLSAEQGNPAARIHLEELEEQMSPAELAEARELADRWMPDVKNVPSPQ